MSASKYFITSGLVAILSLQSSCTIPKKELTFNEKIARGLNTSVDVLTDAQVVSLTNLLLSKEYSLTKAEKQLAYDLGHRSIDIIDTNLLGPVFGQTERIVGRDVPVSLGSDGKTPTYKKLGEEIIVSRFSTALRCFILSENPKSIKDIEFIMMTLRDKNNGRDTRIQRLYDEINEEFSIVFKQFIERRNDSEEGLDFVIACMSTRFSSSTSPLFIIDEVCNAGLPKTKRYGNALLRMLSERYYRENFLQCFIQRGFSADKSEFEEYGRKIVCSGGALEDLLLIDYLCDGSMRKELSKYVERVMSINSSLGYHLGVCALKYAKNKGVKLPDHFFYDLKYKNMTNLVFDIGDMVEFYGVYGLPVSDCLTKRFNLLSKSEVSVQSSAEWVKLAFFMQKFKHSEYEFAQEMAVKSLNDCLVVGSNFKKLGVKKEHDGHDYVSAKDIVDEIGMSPNASVYKGYLRDLLCEAGYLGLVNVCDVKTNNNFK